MVLFMSKDSREELIKRMRESVLNCCVHQTSATTSNLPPGVAGDDEDSAPLHQRKAL